MTDPHEILRTHWGYKAFRPLQEDIIRSVAGGRDTLALLPTGGGKSLCFQVPGIARGGLTLVISPLIALMQDQVRHLRALQIPAAFINSTMHPMDIDRKLEMAMKGKYKFLYVAPERLQTKMFQARLDRMDVTLLAVDEAHCVSQWGYDFRPSYMRIAELREALPGVPLVALTASAPPEVEADIRDKLEMKDPQTFRKSFRRANLAYEVIDSEDPAGRILRYLQAHPGESGIVYARTRKRTISLAQLLRSNGVSAAAYHGGLPSAERSRVLEAWIKNEVKVIAATNAFGMGIDKPDVRFVLHYNLPSDLESYYQEAGRGGRDGEAAAAIAFHNERDLDELDRWVAGKYPSWEQLQRHYEVLCNHYGIPNTDPPHTLFPLDLATISKTFGTNPIVLYNSIKTLDNEGLIALNERPDDYGYLRITVRPRDVLAYKEQYPRQAWLLDQILRQFGGESYSEMMRFLPGYLARVMGRDESELQEALGILAERRIISYRKPTGQPTIVFLRERHPLTKRELNWEKYTFLKERAAQRLAAMKAYVEVGAAICRARILEEYFGEKGNADCGKCDVCRERYREGGGSGLAQRMRTEMKVLLGTAEMGYWEIVEGMASGSEAERRDLIRQLLDEKVLERVGALSFRWRS